MYLCCASGRNRKFAHAQTLPLGGYAPRVVDIRTGTVADLPALLGLYDAAVAWLVAAGRPGQWGTVPFSAQPHLVAQFREAIDTGQMRVAEMGTELAGAMWLGPAPRYAPPPDRSELYLHGLVVDRARIGEGIGRALIDYAIAESVNQNKERLRLDCWGGGGRALVRYYERAGFRIVEETALGNGWPAVFMVRP
jgi:GNAT superfamily N-acetyltransferase